MLMNDDFRKMLRGKPVPIYLYQDSEGYTFTNTTFNMSESDKPLRLASIKDVEAEMGTGEGDVYVYPIFVKEGVFVWDNDNMEYQKQP